MLLKSSILTEIFESHTVNFPYNLMELKQCPVYTEEFFLTVIEAAMLFPDSYKSFAGYTARRIEQIIQRLELTEGMHDHNIKGVIAILSEGIFGSFAEYCNHIKWKGFTAKGKGSLAERVLQGEVCGIILLCMLESKSSLKNAILEAISIVEDIKNHSRYHNVLPTMSFDNIQNTIWPRYKNVAWIWAAGVLFDIPQVNNQLNIAGASLRKHYFVGDHSLPNGWRGFIIYAMRFYKMLINFSYSENSEKRIFWTIKFGTFFDEVPFRMVNLVLQEKGLLPPYAKQ